MSQNAAGFAIFGIFIIVEIVIVIFMVVCAWKIVSKSGYHGALSLLMIIPLVNVVMVAIFAFAEWPVLKELKLLKSQVGRPPFQQ
jgi:heme/copper-type cytochrome/quinol oxidase subunit 2